MIFIKPQYAQASREHFVDLWSTQYDASTDELYEANISKPLTPSKIRQLFVWKNGTRLSERKAASVEKNFVAHASLLATLPDDLGAVDFLAKFAQGGAIWRIFWLHCWQPARFPIYDMHVHRAMEFIETATLAEIPTRDAEKVTAYINRYLPFYAKFRRHDRGIDRALWAYGKFLKNYRFPYASQGDINQSTNEGNSDD